MLKSGFASWLEEGTNKVPETFSVPKKVSKRGIKGDGRPSKLTPAVMAKLKEAFALGLTDDQAASVVGVSDMTLTTWKRNPSFMAEIRGAVNERLMLRLKRIEAGENGWQGCGWLLERLLPRQWAKPEVLIAVQNNLSLNGGGGSSGLSLEQMVVADLQFEKLRQNPNYQHRSHERPAREVEASVVAVGEKVSGTLVRTDYPRAVVISESQAEENQRRIEKARKEIAAKIAAKVGKSSAPIEPENVEPAETAEAMTSGPIGMPTGMPSQAWWAQLTTGSGERKIERAAAEWVCSQLLGETLGAGQGARIQFDADATIAEVIDVLERAAGPRARQMLVRKAGLA